jgi:hypothetical protein
MNARQYIPGQRLNSTAEVMQALLDKQRLGLSSNGFIELMEDGEIYDSEGYQWVGDNLVNRSTPWSIYTPPKRKVKTSMWFAIIRLDYWSKGYSSMAEASYYWPNALTYMKAECEVEGDENDY